MITVVPYPEDQQEFSDFATAFRRHVLPGFVPASPPLARSDIVFTQGSCFAQNIHQALLSNGVDSTYLPVTEKVNTPALNRLLFEYAFEDVPFRCPQHARSFSKAMPKYKKRVTDASLIIFTVGVGYVPYMDGEIATSFTREELLKVRWELSSVEDNVDHLTAIIGIARTANPNAHIVLTVSPVPLRNSFNEQSAVVADCISKVTLRTAVAEVMKLKLHNVHYWPSFEGVRWLSGHIGKMYGVDDGRPRHIGTAYIDAIVAEFVRAFFKNS